MMNRNRFSPVRESTPVLSARDRGPQPDRRPPVGVPADPAPNRSCKALLRSLRALDFAINETVLYLDAYPDSAEALAYYHALNDERASVLAQYETSCAPLTIYSNRSSDSWDWISSPWPWQPDAN